MRKITYCILSILCLSLAIWVSSCKDDEPHCPDAHVTANFTIGQIPFGPDTIFIGDTVLTDRVVVLEAAKGHKGYEWKIGKDPYRQAVTDRITTLRFPLPFNSIEIRLIVHSKPNTVCFPNDDGIDTLIKYLTVIDRLSNPIRNGRFSGYLAEEPSNTFVVEIIDGDIRNLNEGCLLNLEQLLSSFDETFAYRKMRFGRDNCCVTADGCRDPKGWAVLSSNNVDITIDFTTQINSDDPLLTHKFIGKRIK